MKKMKRINDKLFQDLEIKEKELFNLRGGMRSTGAHCSSTGLTSGKTDADDGDVPPPDL